MYAHVCLTCFINSVNYFYNNHQYLFLPFLCLELYSRFFWRKSVAIMFYKYLLFVLSALLAVSLAEDDDYKGPKRCSKLRFLYSRICSGHEHAKPCELLAKLIDHRGLFLDLISQLKAHRLICYLLFHCPIQVRPFSQLVQGVFFSSAKLSELVIQIKKKEQNKHQ